MITRGLSCDRVGFGHFGGGSHDPPDPPLATGLIVDASKYVVVHLVFFFSKSDHKSLSYGHFNIIAQECTR